MSQSRDCCLWKDPDQGLGLERECGAVRPHLPCSKSSLQQTTRLSAVQVLDVINSAEHALFEQQPELGDAQVFVHLTSHVEVRRPAVPMLAQRLLAHLLAAMQPLKTLSQTLCCNLNCGSRPAAAHFLDICRKV